MSDSTISVIDLAAQLGTHKQSLFRVLRRLGIECTRRLGANNRGQVISYITQDEARRVIDDFRSNIRDSEEDASSIPDALLAEQGVFYLLALEPDSDPGRFKVGFAGTLPERLRAIRCSAPFAKVVATWPCKRLWEKTAIDCVAAGCDRLHTEVFRTKSIELVRERCDRFFAMMPVLIMSADDTEKSRTIESSEQPPAVSVRTRSDL